jgi:hypothetical protein
MYRSAGFASVELVDVTGAPRLYWAVNNRTWVPHFHPDKDEHVCSFFKSKETGVTTNTVFIELDGFGVPCEALTATGDDGYLIAFRCPPGD